MIKKLTDPDLRLFKILKNKVCTTTNHQIKVNHRINNILHKGNKRHTFKYLNRIGGSFDLMENSLIGEGITVLLLMSKNSMFLEEKILELAILIIYIVLIYPI